MNDQQELAIGAALEMFVVYENPSDFPGKFVVRRWLIRDKPIPDRAPWIVCDMLEAARETIPAGLVRMPRISPDDPTILETWF